VYIALDNQHLQDTHTRTQISSSRATAINKVLIRHLAIMHKEVNKTVILNTTTNRRSFKILPKLLLGLTFLKYLKQDQLSMTQTPSQLEQAD
jgi:hypothetical protein